jgi:hypothetical protein
MNPFVVPASAGRFVVPASAGKKSRLQARPRAKSRRGAATLDYVLVMCIVLPLAVFLFRIGPRIIHSVYDVLTVLVASPFM